MVAILSGICVPFQEMQVSGAELVAPVLNIEQSAKWTDEENYKAELTLRLSGLNTLKDVSKVDQEQEKIQAEMETESFTEDAGRRRKKTLQLMRERRRKKTLGKVEQRRKLKLKIPQCRKKRRNIF